MTALILIAVIVTLIAVMAGYLYWKAQKEQRRRDEYNGISPTQRAQMNLEAAVRRAQDAEAAYYAKNPGYAKIVCDYCHVAGHVRVTQVQRKQGVSGGKATSALLTGGASLVLVGLSKKGWVHHLKCTNCRMEWDVA